MLRRTELHLAAVAPHRQRAQDPELHVLERNTRYEQLKELTRGKEGITRESLQAFIKGLTGIPDSERQRLLAMTPSTYVGIAADLARKI